MTLEGFVTANCAWISMCPAGGVFFATNNNVAGPVTAAGRLDQVPPAIYMAYPITSVGGLAHTSNQVKSTIDLARTVKLFLPRSLLIRSWGVVFS